MKQFDIDDARSDGAEEEHDGLFYDVRVYPTRRDFQRAIKRYHPDEDHSKSLAVTTHEIWITINKDGSETIQALAGTIFCHQEMLDAEVVSHECTHVALNLYRRRHRNSGNLGTNQDEASVKKEEEVVLSVGRLSQAFSDCLWELKLWTKPSHIIRGRSPRAKPKK